MSAYAIPLNGNIVLPPIVSLKESEEAYIITPLISNTWIPNGTIAYINFNSESKSPTLRFSNLESVSNCVIIGYFTFPASLFDISI